MIEIRRVEDISLAKMVCKENNIDYQEHFHVIATIDNEEVLQSAVFEYKNESGTIHAISGFGGDILLLDGLCRAILNIMDINGVKDVHLSPKYQKLASYVGFSKQSDWYHLKLEGFFKCSCSSKREE